MTTTYGYAAAEAPDRGGHEVQLCSGETLTVQTEVEKHWFDSARSKYLEETRFTENTDLQDLDRLLSLELLLFRWNQHLAKGHDYQGNVVDDEGLRRSIKDQSQAITLVKQSLGLDKKSRDAAMAEGNFATWLADVKRRAKIFGVHREKQLQKSLVLINELSAVVRAYDRGDAEERKKLGFESCEEIVGWIRESMLPAFHVIDEHFRANEQRYWTRDL